MHQEWQFWLLGHAVATVQGGSQALSRSLFGRMLPKSQSAEFYSFFGVSEKIAGAAVRWSLAWPRSSWAAAGLASSH